jgi:hypothetical protein
MVTLRLIAGCWHPKIKQARFALAIQALDIEKCPRSVKQVFTLIDDNRPNQPYLLKKSSDW